MPSRPRPITPARAMALEARANRAAFAGLTSHLERPRQPSDAERLRASHVWDTRANPILARAQSGNAEGGALISASTLSTNQKKAKRELDAALAEQERNDARVDRARTRYEELTGDRFQDIGSDVFRNSSGEVVPNTRANRLAEPSERWEAEARASRMPLTFADYMRGLRREYHVDAGMPFTEGTVSTTISYHVVSAYDSASRENGLLTAPRGSHYRNTATESFKWTNTYAYSSHDDKLLYYLKDGDVKTADGAGGVVVDAEALLACHPQPALKELNFRNVSLVASDGQSFARGSFTFTPAQMAAVRDALTPFLPAGAEARRWCLAQAPGFPTFGDTLLNLLFNMVKAELPYDVYMAQHDDPRHEYRHHASNTQRVIENTHERYERFLWKRFGETYPEAAHIMSSTSLALLIDDVIANNATPAAAVDPMEQALGDSFVAEYLNTRYMRVDLNPDATDASSFIKRPELVLPESVEGHKCCGYELIVDTWSDSIMAEYERGRFVKQRKLFPDISVASLRKVFGSKSVDDYKISVDNLKFFCTNYNLKLDIYDARMALVDRVLSTGENNKISPRHLAVAVTGGHIFHLNGSNNSMFRLSELDAKQLEAIEAPSADYPLTDPEKCVTKMFHIETLEGLRELDLASVPQLEKRLSVADIRINLSLDEVAEMCLNEWKVYPTLGFSHVGHAVTSVAITVTLVDKKAVKLLFRNPIAPGSLQLAVSQSASRIEAELLERRRAALHSALLNMDNLSRFNPAGLAFFGKDTRGPFAGLFEGVVREDYPHTYEYDACSAHPSVLRKLKLLPKFNACDYPEAYDGHAFEDHTCYLLDRDARTTLNNVQTVLLHNPMGDGRSIIWGDELKEMWPHLSGVVEVSHFFRPFELVENETPEAIDSFLRDTALPLKQVKGEMLRTLGLLGKKENKVKSTRVFALESEAAFFRSAYGGEVRPYHYNIQKVDGVNATADKVWVWASPVLSTRLESGFLPIYNRVLSGCRMILARTVLMGEAAGMSPLAGNTDAIFFAQPNAELARPFDKRDPANLGRLSCKPKALPEKGVVNTEIRRGDYTRSSVLLRPRTRLVDVELEHENCNELASIVNTRDGLVLADAPGAGKTTILLNSFKKLHRDALIVVPANTRILELRALGFTACTYDGFLNLRVQKGCLVDVETGSRAILRPDGSTARIDDFSTIMFDELAMLESFKRGRLAKRIAVLRGQKKPPTLWATADVHQIPPIEKAVNPCIDEKAYISLWLRDLFPTCLTLHKLRRWVRPECQELIKRMRHMLFVEKAPKAEVLALFPRITRDAIPLDAHVLTYFRRSRRELNKFMHSREHEEAWVVGERVVYDSHTRVHGKAKLYKNYMYKVTSVSAYVDLVDVSDAALTFRLSLAQATAWLAYPHANTGHSSQGSTYDRPIVVADTSSSLVTAEWLYVAGTRNRDTRTVFILTGESGPKPVNKHVLQRNIDGHNAADVAAGREVGDLDVEWVLDRFKRQKGLCALCAEEMDLPRYGESGVKGTAVSIDRIVSVDRGHVRGNVQLCHASCNFAKGAR